MNYRVYIIQGDKQQRYAEAVNLDTANAVFASVPIGYLGGSGVVELRYLSPISTKWSVLARKGNIVPRKEKTIYVSCL